VRRPPLQLACLLAAALIAAGCGKADDSPTPPAAATESGSARHFDVQRIATGLNRPTFVGAAPGDDGALWVLEQPGRVLRVAGGNRRVALDYSDRVRTGAEQGLLGIAFHPDFASNGRLFLHWSERQQGDTRVAELRLRDDGTIDPAPVRMLLEVEQPEENHNGGQLAFGPDGRLYLGLGDGGGAFDPHGNGQRREGMLGKIVSVNVDAEEPRWRTELYGLRNPWRFSFDVGLGEIWIADVGQDGFEEVNRVLLEPDEPPKNLGWSAYEGTEPVDDGPELAVDGEVIWPVAVYTHEDGCSITGGPVYAGVKLPKLSRRYVYGDYCSGTIWSLEAAPGGKAEDVRRERARVPQLTHIGTDSDGELVFASGSGALYRAVRPAAPTGSGSGS
jgi:glucose/arabinose dehydrogenase